MPYREKESPVPGSRIVVKVPEAGVEQPWPSHTVRYKSRSWSGPVHIRAQGIEFNIRYVGIHEHVESGRYPLHIHPHCEFLFTVCGKGVLYVPDRKVELACEPGSLLVLPPSLAHGARWALDGDGTWRMIVVNYDIAVDMGQVLMESGETVDLAFSPFYEWFHIREQTTLLLEDAERKPVMQILDEISDTLSKAHYGVGSDVVAGLIRVVSLFSRALRRAGLADGTHMAPPMFSKEAALLKARSLMEQGEMLDAGCVARIAKTVGMAESHFIREFKRAYGTTPKQYSLDVLMRRAAALMSRTDIPVKDAAFSLGYEDPSSFSRAFQRYFGVSPTRYSHRGDDKACLD